MAFEYRSAQSWRGIPLIHIAFGRREGGRYRAARARGLIASSHDPVALEHGLLAEGSSIWDCGLRRVADGAASFDALLAGVRQPH